MRIFALAAVLLISSCVSSGPAVPPEIAAQIAQLESTLRADPGSAASLYYLAAYNALAGRPGDSARWLERLLASGWNLGLDEGDFAPIAGDTRYQALARRLNEAEPRVRTSTQAFTLPDRELIPEGITYDPQTKTFFVGSIYKRKVLAVSADGTVRDFATGMLGALGMKVDAGRRLLWVVSGGAEPMQGFDEKTHRGRSELSKYDLESGSLLARFDLGGPAEPAMLNDLEILADGTPVVTDTVRGALYTPRGGRLEPLLPPKTFAYPNGIATDRDRRVLWVATFDGVFRVDPATGARVQVTRPAEVISLAGIDGLSWAGGALYAIQNAIGNPKVWRLELNPAGDAITRAEIVESRNPLFKLPATGTVAGDHFYYMANCQLRSYDPGGKLWPVERLQEVVILRTPLR